MVEGRSFSATVLLPARYENIRHHVPIVFQHWHFSTARPRDSPAILFQVLDADGTPRVIYVTLQHPSPYYDDSYGVNSANNGPYGDAILKELIPEIETRFRVIREPWARVLTGGSTGGWIALALQVMDPDFYGGTFSLCPDGVDFRYHQIVDIYKDANAYWLEQEWTRIERPNQRRPDGNIQSMMKDENWYELTVADRSRSGGQWDIWEASYSSRRQRRLSAEALDKKTGAINKTVAEAWKITPARDSRKNWNDAGAEGGAQDHVYSATWIVIPEHGRAHAG